MVNSNHVHLNILNILCPQPHAWTIQTARWFSTSCFVPLIASISSTPATQVQQRFSFREFRNIYLLCVYIWYVAIVILQGSNWFILCLYYVFSHVLLHQECIITRWRRTSASWRSAWTASCRSTTLTSTSKMTTSMSCKSRLQQDLLNKVQYIYFTIFIPCSCRYGAAEPHTVAAFLGGNIFCIIPEPEFLI